MIQIQINTKIYQNMIVFNLVLLVNKTFFCIANKQREELFAYWRNVNAHARMHLNARQIKHGLCEIRVQGPVSKILINCIGDLYPTGDQRY